MILPILSTQQTDPHTFISFWGSRYNYEPSGEMSTSAYFKIIEKYLFSEDDLLKLYEWKNGMILSPGKRQFVERRVLPQINRINELKTGHFSDRDILHFVSGLTDGTYVWSLFLAHIIAPDRFPIFDQHTYRAYMYLNFQLLDEDKEFTSKLKGQSFFEDFYIDFYEKRYLPFYRELQSLTSHPKDADNALFAFGKYLKNPMGQVLLAGSSTSYDGKFMRSLFDSVYSDHEDLTPKTKSYIKQYGHEEEIEKVIQRKEQIRLCQDWELKNRMAKELQNNGIAFQDNSEGPDFIISLCCAIQERFGLPTNCIYLLLKSS